MKNHIKILFFASIIILLAACNKQNPDGGDPPYTWNIHFILTDSADRPLLPVPLPINPQYNPNEFNAYNYKNENIGDYYEGRLWANPDSAQYIFNLSESFESIKKNPSYVKDSLFKWYVCFGKQCDTIIVYPKQLTGENVGSAKLLIWAKDTLYNYDKAIIRIRKLNY